MTPSRVSFEVYLEIGKKQTIAGALEWPGWCRAGRDEDSALQALVDYGPRYAQVLDMARIAFEAPAATSAFAVVERLEGDATTDFGAPSITPSADKRPLDEAELKRFQTLLTAYWQAFDTAVGAASGKELRKGPRGGGRELEGIVGHVIDGDKGYLARLAWKLKQQPTEAMSETLAQTRQAILDALAAAARGELPSRGPRGGIIWSPYYFVRRVGWHVLDHVWEIEDRVM
jgi:hypothetical protein